MAFVNPWDETSPTGAEFLRDVDDYMRQLKRAIRERMNEEHYAYASEGGKTNIWRHKPGSAKILSVPRHAQLPTTNSDAPGTLAILTDYGILAWDSGDGWIEIHGDAPGVIKMWSGSIADIPYGWALCDGKDGRPDLREKFILGAGGEYDPGDTGGEEEVTLTVEQIPEHKHTGSTETAGKHGHSGETNTTGEHTHSYTTRSSTMVAGLGGSNAWYGTRSTSTGSGGLHKHTLNITQAGEHTHGLAIDNTGGGQPHNNMPPFYALAFIIKL